MIPTLFHWIHSMPVLCLTVCMVTVKDLMIFQYSWTSDIFPPLHHTMYYTKCVYALAHTYHNRHKYNETRSHAALHGWFQRNVPPDPYNWKRASGSFHTPAISHSFGRARYLSATLYVRAISCLKRAFTLSIFVLIYCMWMRTTYKQQQ